MSRTETDAFHHSHVRSRMYQPAAMLVHDLVAMLAKNAGAVPLIHGPVGCASLRQMSGGRISAACDPESVLMVGNIRYAYGVGARVVSDGEGPCIVPVRPVNQVRWSRLQKKAVTCLMKNPARSTAYVLCV